MPVIYYNEIDPYAAQWLRNLIKAGHIADGEVDTRSIVDVHADDVRGFTQAHFFAGIGGWSHALRLSRWPDHRKIWTGSCPCQPFSVAGKGAGIDDPRHLWPHFFRLIAAARPPVVMGEQVAGSAGYGWLDGVRADLEAEGYASRGVDIPACAVDAPHIRSRLYWVASDVADTARELPHGSKREGGRRPEHPNSGDVGDANNARLEGQRRHGDGGAGRSGEARPIAAAGGGDVADADKPVSSQGWEQRGGQQRGSGGDQGAGDDSNMANAPSDRREMALLVEGGGSETIGERQTDVNGGSSISFWSNHIWLTGADGKSRRAPPGIPLLANGIPNRVGKLRAYGNAIVPPLAAEVIKSYMDCQP